MSYPIRRMVLLSFLIVLLALGGCSRKRDEREANPIWTPSAVTGALQLATPGAPVLPTAVTGSATGSGATAGSAAAGGQNAPATRAAATRDPNLVIVTENDVLKAVTSGAAAQEGAELDGVSVDFQDGKMRLTAARAKYQFITVDNLVVVGRLVARDGKLQMETESVSPRGIVTSFIPTIANQALANYTSRWYVEDVETYEDRLELRVRP